MLLDASSLLILTFNEVPNALWLKRSGAHTVVVYPVNICTRREIRETFPDLLHIIRVLVMRCRMRGCRMGRVM